MARGTPLARHNCQYCTKRLAQGMAMAKHMEMHARAGLVTRRPDKLWGGLPEGWEPTAAGVLARATAAAAHKRIHELERASRAALCDGRYEDMDKCEAELKTLR